MISEVQAGSTWLGHCFNRIKTSVMGVAHSVDEVYQQNKVLIASVLTAGTIMTTVASGNELSQEMYEIVTSVALLVLSKMETNFVKKTASVRALVAGTIFAGGGVMNICISGFKNLILPLSK